MSNLIETVQTFVLSYGLNILGAILILIVGRWAAGIISRLVQQILGKTNTDDALIRFAKSITYYAILIFALLAALDRVGVQTTSFIALTGAAGLAVGLALEGALSNFAAGVLILLFRPFKIGDMVELAGTLGTVEEILIFSTIIITLDNKTVIIPNSQVTGGPIVNYSKKELLRLDTGRPSIPGKLAKM